jgi:DegV family protein with EDD domain
MDTKVRVVTDSTADIPAAMAARLGISVIPSYVVFGSETFRDGVDLASAQFYQKLAEAKDIPTTAAPPPSVYEEAYRRLAKETDSIVSIHLASSLSALHNSASVAARNVSEAQIEVIDSEQVTMGYGWMAIAAAQAAQRGDSLEQIVTLVEGMKHRTRVLAVLDTLELLFRGGRVNWAQAMIGTLLQIKPILEIRLGEVHLVERARTFKHALRRLLGRIEALGPLERAIVLHANAPDQGERLADRLQTIAPSWERLVGQAGVTIASHAGPGALGIACVVAA